MPHSVSFHLGLHCLPEHLFRVSSVQRVKSVSRNIWRIIYRGSIMSVHVLFGCFKSWGKEVKCEACRAFYLFFKTSLINS